MPKLDNIKVIVSDDFPATSQQTISQLSEILNPFMNQVFSILNGNVDFDNLKSEKIVSFKIKVDANGFPVGVNKFTAAVGGAVGGKVVSARNLTTPTNYVTSAPFICFDPSSGTTYKINKIVGLQANEDYQITLELTIN